MSKRVVPRDRRVAGVAVLSTLLLVAIGLLTGTALAATRGVEVGSFYYQDGATGSQSEIRVAAGDQLRFEVVDSGRGTPHTVEIDAFGVHSGPLRSGQTYTTPPLNTPGTYRVYCDPHEQRGHTTTLIVEGAAPPPPPPSPSPSPTATTSPTATSSPTATTSPTPKPSATPKPSSPSTPSSGTSPTASTTSPAPTSGTPGGTTTTTGSAEPTSTVGGTDATRPDGEPAAADPTATPGGPDVSEGGEPDGDARDASGGEPSDALSEVGVAGAGPGWISNVLRLGLVALVATAGAATAARVRGRRREL